MATDLATKMKTLKMLLGEEAAQQTLALAEQREKAAELAGLDSKEVKVALKDEEAPPEGPVSLAALLEQIDEGLESGEIVNDLPKEVEEVGGESEPELDEAQAQKEFNAYVTELVDARVKEHLDNLLPKFKEMFMPREQERAALVEATTKALKDMQARTQALQAQLDELNGIQPKGRANGYRASQAVDTIKETAETKEGPMPDPVDSFLNNFFLKI